VIKKTATEKHVPNLLHGIKKEEQNRLIEPKQKEVLETAGIETCRILNYLGLQFSLKARVLEKFKKIRIALRPGTKYRIVEKLVPLTIYFVCSYENVSLNEAKLLEVSGISKKEFTAFKLQILEFFPEYQERSRKHHILQKIVELSEHFQLGIMFYYRAKGILYKLWEDFKGNTDTMLAGLVVSISALQISEKKVKVSEICDWFDIPEGTIRSKIDKNIRDKIYISKDKLNHGPF